MNPLKAKIVRVAWQQFAAEGEAGVSLRRIARKLNITHPAVYTYFPSKEDLMAELKLSAFHKLQQYLFRDINPHSEFNGLMQQLTENFVDFIEEWPDMLKAILFLRGNDSTAALQLQLLEYIDQMAIVPEKDINLPQIIWYALIGHGYAYYSGEITKRKKFELVHELVDRLSGHKLNIT